MTGDRLAMLFARIMKGDIERHARVAPGDPEWLDAVVARALAHGVWLPS